MQVIHFVIHMFIIWLGYISDNCKVISIHFQAWKITRQFETNSSHVPTHLLDLREGLGNFIVFAKVQYGFLTTSSNICRFSLKGVFFSEAPCIFSACLPLHLTNSTFVFHCNGRYYLNIYVALKTLCGCLRKYPWVVKICGWKVVNKTVATKPLLLVG